MTITQALAQSQHAVTLRGNRGKPGNDLLSALPCHEFEALQTHLDLVALPFGKVLFDFGSALDDVFFPTSAVVSLLYVMTSGATTEIAVVGREGVAGVSLFKGETANCSAVVQGEGQAYRIRNRHLRAAFEQGGALPELLMRYTNSLFAQMARSAVCGRHSSIERKLCRWLLERLDRAPSNDLKVTQATISILLGVRRESITAAAGKLQQDGLIHCSRGRIAVLDRDALEAIAGECYRVTATAPQ